MTFDALADSLDPREDRELRRAFGTWLSRVLSEAKFPEAEGIIGEELEDSRDMLRERVREWSREWEQQGLKRGLEEGMEKGMEKGLRKGEQRVLLHQLERKFGTPDAATQRRIETADDDQLLTWSENLLSADRLEDVFH